MKKNASKEEAGARFFNQNRSGSSRDPLASRFEVAWPPTTKTAEVNAAALNDQKSG
jgi:hypothetical protein